MILEKGCKYINLQSSQIVGSLTLSRNDYDVKYLNLTNCYADKGVLEKLISSCQSLQKLSLAHLRLSSNAIKSCNFQHLQTLYLHHFEGLDLEMMSNILSSKTLTELSFRYLDIKSDQIVQYLVENLSSDVEKVSLGKLTRLTDEQLKTLVERCKKIKELELYGCQLLTDDSLKSIVEHSDQIVKLDISYTKIGLGLSWSDEVGAFVKLLVQGANPFLQIQSMPKLKYFNCKHNMYDRSYEEIEDLRKLMPQFRINFGVFGKYIANPNLDPNPKPENGLWEIDVKTIKLFRFCTGAAYRAERKRDNEKFEIIMKS